MMFKNISTWIFLIVYCVSLCNAEQFKVTDQVYFDISKDGKPLGRMVIGLFGEIAPKTVENFKHIATEGIDGKTYAGTRFHRVIKRFMIQEHQETITVLDYLNSSQKSTDIYMRFDLIDLSAGGDIINNDGRGTISIYGPNFEDENLQTEYRISGLISMANKGTDTNGCQFFINTIPTPWLNGLHTIFGKVVEGQDYVHIIEHSSTDVDDHPTREIKIEECGVIETPTPFFVSDEPYDIWAWLRASAVPLTMSFSILGAFHWMIKKMEI